MAVAPLHHGVDQFSVIGHEQEAFGILVQPSRVGQADGIFKGVPDGPLGMGIPFCTGDPDRFIPGHYRGLLSAPDHFAVDLDPLPAGDPHAGYGRKTVHIDTHLFDQPVRFPPGTDSAGSDVLIQAHAFSTAGHNASSCWAALSRIIQSLCSIRPAILAGSVATRRPNSLMPRTIWSKPLSEAAFRYTVRQ